MHRLVPGIDGTDGKPFDFMLLSERPRLDIVCRSEARLLKARVRSYVVFLQRAVRDDGVGLRQGDLLLDKLGKLDHFLVGQLRGERRKHQEVRFSEKGHRPAEAEKQLDGGHRNRYESENSQSARFPNTIDV